MSLVPALSLLTLDEFSTDEEITTYFVKSEVEGTFPSAFTMQIYEPPPDEVLTPLFDGEPGSAGGDIIAMSPGAAYFEQRFDTEGEAPARRSGAAFGELVLGVSLELGGGAYATLDSALQAYALPMFEAETRRTETRAALTGRLALGGGLRF